MSRFRQFPRDANLRQSRNQAKVSIHNQHRYISPKAAAAWLRCIREDLVARNLDIVRLLTK
jgi:hypothetical protein